MEQSLDLKLLVKYFISFIVDTSDLDIIQSSSVITSLDRSPNLTFLAMKRNFPLNSEMNGNQIGIIFEDILKV